jgi:N-acyl-D-amino-acid deacylase
MPLFISRQKTMESQMPKISRRLLTTALFALGFLFTACSDEPAGNVAAKQPEPKPEVVTYDTIIRHGLVVDGSGQPGRQADVGIRDDRIATVGDLSAATATQEIDASGKVVAPGFINMLSWAVGSLMKDGRGLSDIEQGVTLEVFGEGWSMGPLSDSPETQAMLKEFLGPDGKPAWTTLGEYLEHLEQKGVSPNVASFVGATTLRIHEVGFDDRPPTAEEMANMKALTHQAMQEGAMGLGSSLIYPPAFFATTEELVELAKVVGEYDGMYISHMRSEGNRIEQSVQELITIAREGGIGAEIYHLKLAGKQNWDKLPVVVKMIEDARAEGLDITTDMYTYIAGGTSLSACFPPWASDGGQDALLDRLRDPETRAKIIEAMRTNADDWENLYYGAGPDGVLLSAIEAEGLKSEIGKTLAQVAAERGTNPEETIVDLVLESENTIGAVYFLMNEDNVKAQMKLPYMSFGSDAAAQAPEGEILEQGAHPRTYGNFSRVLGKYVRDEKVIPLEDAIYKLTALPAGNLKVADRGRLQADYYADVVVFDPAAINDHATFDQPHQLATGMEQVFVNGVQVLKDGEHTGATPGRFVRGPGYKATAEVN